MKLLVALLFSTTLFSVEADRVRMDFFVRDPCGAPIEDATIRIHTGGRVTLPFQRPSKIKVSCKTSADGTVSESFQCWDGYVNCFVSANGFYDEKLKDLYFKSSYNRDTETTEFQENHKRITVVLSPVVKPIPMFSHRPDDRRRHLEDQLTSAGYDLKLADWLPPRGRGEVADIYIHHSSVISNGVRVSDARITFEPGGGAYVVKKCDGPSRLIVYAADTNMHFKTSISSSRSEAGSTAKASARPLLLTEDEALVIRSRVKTDSRGNVISANYSKIYGPFSITDVFAFGQICFNPSVNDTNLEFDVHKNKTGRNIGTYYP